MLANRRHRIEGGREGVREGGNKLSGLVCMYVCVYMYNTVNPCASTRPRMSICERPAWPWLKARRPAPRKATVAKHPMGTRGSLLTLRFSFSINVSEGLLEFIATANRTRLSVLAGRVCDYTRQVLPFLVALHCRLRPAQQRIYL